MSSLQPPRSICLLRLSAIGDISHTLPVLRTIQRYWPETRITWIIGRVEYALIGDIPDVQFIIFDKRRRWRAYLDIAKQLRGQRFDFLLHMQMSLRSSLINRLIKCPIRVGFDRERAKDMQWLFNNRTIAAKDRQHVLDSLLGFSDYLGLRPAEICWDIPIPANDLQWAQKMLSQDRPYYVISPCSSVAQRNWLPERYAKIGDYIISRYGYRVVLTGGPTPIEMSFSKSIRKHMDQQPLDLIGKTGLKQLLATLQGARGVIAPDSGPAHLATAVMAPVIGLYAGTNPDRARPYLSHRWLVNRYPDAVSQRYAQPISDLPWGIRVREPETMDLITTDDVLQSIDLLESDYESNQVKEIMQSAASRQNDAFCQNE